MREKTTSRAWIAAIIIVIAIALGAYLLRNGLPHETVPAPTATRTTQNSAESAIQHPIAQARSGPATASTAPLPALASSDSYVMDTLSALAGGKSLQGVLKNGQIIARIVATVDALPSRELGHNILPLDTPKGTFRVSHDDAGTVVMDDANFARFAPYMQLIKSVDPGAVVDWYVHNYPLFQQAYQELGYPNRYFNDRLIVVIDNLLAAPDVTGPIALTQPNVHYKYADNALESLSAGQKTLLRAGPANEAVIKTLLRAIRRDLTGRKLPSAASSSAKPASAGSAG